MFLQQRWEMLPYFKLAAENGYTVLVLEPDTDWSHDPSKLAAMTSHGVPKDKIELMKSRWRDKLEKKCKYIVLL